MAMRITGLNSGMDVESIVQELVSAKQTKVDSLKKEQTKLEWKQDAWKALNTKIFNFYNKTLNSLRLTSTYQKKTTSVSNSSVASVITGSSAMNSTQTLAVKQLAKSGYLTGAQVKNTAGATVTSGETKLADLGINAETTLNLTQGAGTASEKVTQITIDADTTLDGLAAKLKEAGLSANFDAKNGRFYIGASGSGADKDFILTAASQGGDEALAALGLKAYDDATKASYAKYAAMDSEGADAEKQAYRDEFQNRIADRTAQYLAQYRELQEQYTDKLDSYQNKEALTNAKEEAQTALEALQEKDESTLTEDEKQQLEQFDAQVQKLAAQIEEIEEIEGQLANIETYVTVDLQASTVSPTDTLKNEVAGELDSQITFAKEALSAWDADKAAAGSVKISGQDAKIRLNGADYTSDSNVFEINGLTITAGAATGKDLNGDGSIGDDEYEEVTLTTTDDVSGLYDMIKSFVTEYNALINEMDKLYNADSAKNYEPLTDEEKEAMSEDEAEKWEAKIKDSLLRRDSTLGTVSSAFRDIMAAGVEVNGKKRYLSDFGIEKLSYFTAPTNEKNAYHIKGDDADALTSMSENALQQMITADAETTKTFFQELSKALYTKVGEMVKSETGYKSYGTIYADLKMQSDYDGYKKRISNEEKKLQAYEDSWYDKFSAMEVAMAKMQSNANAISGLLGGT
ncbi:MAG: flagellar filament capping protein FliD [Clostridium sp.]|jgi:flagellar hook-associated protein 2|nr:flagellar filament capping protein FliD [Clostridium sp.]